MKFLDNLWLALDALRSNLMRSILTTLGIVIGIFAVIAMVSIGEGAKSEITGQIEALGSNLLTVTPGRVSSGSSIGAFGSGTSLTQDHLALIEACPSVALAAPEVGSNMSVSVGKTSMITNIIGTTGPYAQIRNLGIERGLFFGTREEDAASRVVVIGAGVAEELFPNQDPIGLSMKIGNVKFTITGLLASKGQSGILSNDDVVYIPITTAQRRLLGARRGQLRAIYVTSKSEDVTDLAVAEIEQALLRDLKDPEAFNVSNQADLISVVEDMTTTMTLLLACIAAISLLVGGIGIMNIMLVSVTERIREIGIRKAIGAQEKEILLQFLLEAATLSLLGGLIGIALGATGAVLLSRALGWQAVVSIEAILMASGISLMIGLFFGVYPARKAARLDPIVALRHE